MTLRRVHQPPLGWEKRPLTFPVARQSRLVQRLQAIRRRKRIVAFSRVSGVFPGSWYPTAVVAVEFDTMLAQIKRGRRLPRLRRSEYECAGTIYASLAACLADSRP